MKNKKLYALTSAFSLLAFASIALRSSDSRANDGDIAKEKIACQIKPEFYADNRRAYESLPDIDVKLVTDLPYLYLGQFNSSFDLGQGRALQISGFLSKPGGRWIEPGTELMVTGQLTSSKPSPRVLSLGHGDSNSVNDPAALEKVKAGYVGTYVRLPNTDYLTRVLVGESIASDELVGYDLRCELKRPAN